MSIKNLFSTQDNFLQSSNISDLTTEIESKQLLNSYVEDKNQFIPNIDFSNPKNFCFYGLAEKYHEDTIDYILNTYPYDGSKNEKLEWDLSSSYFDKYIFENEYPRVNGYINLGKGIGAPSSSNNGYERFANNNYITFRGGLHTASAGMSGTPLYQIFNESNYYDPANNRRNNLEISGSGVTLEFWLKKDNFVSGSEPVRQVLFDVWNSSSLAAPDYGRFKVEIRPGLTDGNERKFHIELVSGSSGFSSGSTNNIVSLGSGLNISGSQWHQYSLVLNNTGSSMCARLYASGTLNDSIVTGSSINLITGTMIGTIGSLLTGSIGALGAQLGWAPLSASLDEIRFWKSKRSPKQIGQYWFSQVGAGSNTDVANTDLGLYYKFNEGILTTSSVVNTTDCKVLDYSGRISNGSWTGYVSGSRTTGSAMVESNSSLFEFKDPILYANHPDVIAYKSSKQEQGFAYDITNNASIYNSFPEWILKDDEDKGRNELKKLTQTMASYLDNLYMQISYLPKIKSVNYVSGSSKPLPFVSRLLESAGLNVPNIFSNAEINEIVNYRDNSREYVGKLDNLKNKIYQNIYNNLSFILKSKGTEKSIRNLIRCFGVDDELIKMNLYTSNSTYEYKDNIRYITVPKKYIDFNNPDRFAGTVYQFTSSVTSSKSYIASPVNMIYNGNTYECEVIFPKKFENDSSLYFNTPFLTSSLFGCHTVPCDSLCNPQTDLAWALPDTGNFQIYSVKSKLDSKDVFFKLGGTANCILPELTTSIFKNVYDNQKWNLSLRIKPKNYPWPLGVSGTKNNNFNIEFSGYNYVQDVLQNSFYLTSSISSSAGIDFMLTSKRFFVGSQRTNFTGSVLHYVDTKISSLRVWASYLTDGELIKHSQDVSNYGVDSPYKNNYMTEISRSFGV